MATKLTTCVVEAEDGRWTLAWGEEWYGPDFDSKAACTSFLAFVAMRTNLDPKHNESRLDSLYEVWKKEPPRVQRLGRG